MTFTAQDATHMAQALRLAERGLYTAHPNPRVGCVIIDAQGKSVGEGWHARAGEAHAEINALKQADEKAQGGTAYITLEPCCHHGRTPPCTQTLIKAGIARVVFATADPNPQVNGNGAAELSRANIIVESGLFAEQSEALNHGFNMRMRKNRPFVRIKTGISLDGRTAMASGESHWITGEAARQDVQHWRAQSSAILTGSGTVAKDNPRLTVRNIELSQQPLRVVVDGQLNIEPTAQILQQDGKTLIATAGADEAKVRALAESGAALIDLPDSADSRHVDLPALMRHLAQQEEINEVLVEAGPGLTGALLQQHLADQLIIYVAPRLLGDDARGLFHLPKVKALQDSVQLKINDIRAVGDDWRIIADVLSDSLSHKVGEG